jgi:hypothetical protein
MAEMAPAHQHHAPEQITSTVEFVSVPAEMPTHQHHALEQSTSTVEFVSVPAETTGAH